MEICVLKLQSEEPGAWSDQIQIPNLTVLVCVCVCVLLSRFSMASVTQQLCGQQNAEQERHISHLQA